MRPFNRARVIHCKVHQPYLVPGSNQPPSIPGTWPICASHNSRLGSSSSSHRDLFKTESGTNNAHLVCCCTKPSHNLRLPQTPSSAVAQACQAKTGLGIPRDAVDTGQAVACMNPIWASRIKAVRDTVQVQIQASALPYDNQAVHIALRCRQKRCTLHGNHQHCSKSLLLSLSYTRAT